MILSRQDRRHKDVRNHALVGGSIEKRMKPILQPWAEIVGRVLL